MVEGKEPMQHLAAFSTSVRGHGHLDDSVCPIKQTDGSRSTLTAIRWEVSKSWNVDGPRDDLWRQCVS